MKKISAALASMAIAALLVACGGGEVPGNASGVTSAPVGASTPGAPTDPGVAALPNTVSGTVTGFASSVAVDGVDYSAAANATVALDVDPRAETAATMADVKLGQQVEAALDDNGQVTKLFVRATVIGPVDSVDATGGSFKVVGQTVKVVTTGDAKTAFEGIDDLTKLKVGDWVEVHGTLDTDKNIVATRVELKPAAGTIAVRAGGLVKNLNAAANPKTFKLGDLTINYTNAVIKPEGATLANDDFVFVYSDQLPTAGTLVAKAVRVMKSPTLDGRRVSIGGLVTEASADGRKFKVNGLAVDATKAELKGGQNPAFTDIKLMALVRVEGTLAVAAGAVTLNATRVWLIPASEQRRVVLTGQVTDYLSAKSFKVRGVPVNADGASLKGGVIGDLKAGAFVTVVGRIDGTMVKADEVRFGAPPRGMDLHLLGVVSEYKAMTGEFKLLGIPMKLAPNTVFQGGTLADFSDGDLVDVRGVFDGAAFLVGKVEFRNAAITPSIYLEGTLTNLNTTTKTFSLNGGTIKYDDQTVITNGPLAANQHVEVRAQLVGADVVAREIEVQIPGATVRLMGLVSDVKAADKTFVVRGQTVTWSDTTQFRGGAAKDLSNGDLVKVDASLAGGKANATKVTFLRP
ncbi:MAG TPA: DUF5666 domain-containing protein [Burkholderiaceae bacterium]|nr:DUF5666 domain-containing protein [Burkholderiaceae bacterium]